MQGAEIAFLGTGLLDDLDAAFAGQQLGVDDVDVLVQPVFEQAGGEGGRDQPGAAPGHLAAVAQLGPPDGALAHLGVQQAQPAGHVHVEPQLFQLGAVDGRHVDCEADDAARQEVDQQLGRLHGHRRLGLDGGGAEVRRHHDVGQLEQRMVGRRRFLHEDVEGGPGQVAGLQGLGQGLLVDDAAAGAVEHAAPLRISASWRAPIRSRVSSVSGVWTVRKSQRGSSWLQIGHALDAELGGAVGCQERIEADDLHVEAGGAAGDLAADASQADDSQGLAGQLRADELVALPLALAAWLASAAGM